MEKRRGDWSGDLNPGRHRSTQIVCRGSRGTLSEVKAHRPFPHHRAGFPVPRGKPRGLPVSMRGSWGQVSCWMGQGWGAAERIRLKLRVEERRDFTQRKTIRTEKKREKREKEKGRGGSAQEGEGTREGPTEGQVQRPQG